jgi:hypothetical protein
VGLVGLACWCGFWLLDFGTGGVSIINSHVGVSLFREVDWLFITSCLFKEEGYPSAFSSKLFSLQGTEASFPRPNLLTSLFIAMKRWDTRLKTLRS